jgi:hypothetical protein
MWCGSREKAFVEEKFFLMTGTPTLTSLRRKDERADRKIYGGTD